MICVMMHTYYNAAMCNNKKSYKLQGSGVKFGRLY